MAWRYGSVTAALVGGLVMIMATADLMSRVHSREIAIAAFNDEPTWQIVGNPVLRSSSYRPSQTADVDKECAAQACAFVVLGPADCEECVAATRTWLEFLAARAPQVRRWLIHTDDAVGGCEGCTPAAFGERSLVVRNEYEFAMDTGVDVAPFLLVFGPDGRLTAAVISGPPTTESLDRIGERIVSRQARQQNPVVVRYPGGRPLIKDTAPVTLDDQTPR